MRSTMHCYRKSITDGSVGLCWLSFVFDLRGEDLSELTVKKKKDEKLVVRAEECSHKDVMISDSHNSEITLCGTPTTLHLTNLTKTTVISLPVSTSVFVDDCKECTFVVACQQLRMHSSAGCRVYLHVTSSGIIEDCTGIRVAPYSLQSRAHPDILVSSFGEARLNPSINNWSTLEDFHWLAAGKHSPNWSILPEEQRVKFIVD